MYLVHEPVLLEDLEGPCLEQLLRLHGRLVVLVPSVNSCSDDILELVVGAQGLLGPFGQGLVVDAVLSSCYQVYSKFKVR